jgi:LPXTG-motif cell wall-anchored protein
MWLAKDPGISAKSDPRLISLSGTVTIEKGLGQSSLGPLVDVPIFTFTVPPVTAGAYLLYYSCPGSPNGWDSLFEGAAFTVTQGVPGTDLPRTNGALLPAAGWLGIFAVLLLTAGAVFIRRRMTA